MDSENLVTLSAVCGYLNVSRTTLWRLSKRADFPKPIRIGRIIRYRISEIASYFKVEGDCE